MVRILFSIISIFICCSSFALERVTANVDKNPVMKGESFILEIIADDNVNRNSFDSSVLLKEFIVGQTSVSSQTSMVNGSTTRTTKFTTVLVPKKVGKFVIPSFTIDGKKSQEIALVVVEKPKNNAQEQRDIFIKSSLSESEVYVQQQLTLTVKLYYAVNLDEASLSDPLLNDAIITKLGQDQQNQEIINGRRYQIITRTFAVTPQKSGNFTLEMPIFSGSVSLQSQRQFGLFNRSQSKPVTVLSDPINIIVKPQPANYQGQWLPSELVSLHDEWQPENKQFKVGEPITRTVTLTAIGLTKEQLPDINLTLPAGLKVYPDQAQGHTGMNANRVISQSVNNFAIVATKAGEYQLPAVKIAWFNTKTNQQEFATLDAIDITVQENPELAANHPQPVQKNQSTTLTPLPEAKVETVIVEKSSWLQWLFLGLWLITSALWLISAKTKKAPKVTTTNTKALAQQAAYQQLMTACKENNGQAALTSIIPWARMALGNNKITKLPQVISAFNNDELTVEITQLQASYYAKATQPWQGKSLLNVIQKLNKSKNKSELTDVSLNP